MKIIHIIPSLGSGGAEKLVVDLCNELSKKDEVIILLFREMTDDMHFQKMITSEVKVIELDKNKGFDFIFQLNLVQILLKESPEIIHAHLSAVNYLFFPIALLFNTQVFHTIHTLAHLEEKRIFFIKLRKAYYYLNLIIPVSITKLTKNTFIHLYELNKTFMINNGIQKLKLSNIHRKVSEEISELKKNVDTVVFIAVGRLCYAKNFSMLAHAFSKLEDYNAILLIIGTDITKEKKYENEIKRYKSKNSFLLGAKSNVADYLNYADAFCISSHHEGMPISVLEAMSLGLPIITTPAGGMIDMVKNKINGFISNEFSLVSYINILEDFLKLGTKGLQKIHQNNLDKFNNNYSIKICASNHKVLYEKFMKK